MSNNFVLAKKEETVGKLILNRPEKLNAIIGEMREEIIRTLENFASDESIRVVILTGAGRGFCAGGDVEYLCDLLEKKNLEGLKNLLLFGKQAVTIMRTMPKPIIAAVNGPAAGAGLNLAVACDIRLASDQASFGASFAKIGLHPDWGGSWFLPRLVGPSFACEMVFTGEMIDAKEALRIGLANHVYPHAEFPDRVREFASVLANRPAGAIGLAKRLLWQSIQSDLEATLEKEIENQLACFQEKDAWEGIHAFLEKRQPVFIRS